MRYLLLMALLVGCSAPAAPEAPDPTPTPDLYTDAEAAHNYAQGLYDIFGTEPQADWWPAIVVDENGLPVVTIDNGDWVYVNTHLQAGSEDAAMVICNAVKTLVYDEEGRPLGINDVLVFGADSSALADCDVPVLPGN